MDEKSFTKKPPFWTKNVLLGGKRGITLKWPKKPFLREKRQKPLKRPKNLKSTETM